MRIAAPQTVTLKEGEASGEGATAVTEEEQIKQQLRIHRMDLRPTFLYFHYGHEKDPKSKKDVSAAGKACEKQCGIVADQTFARWGGIVRLIEVDMDRSDVKIASRLGLGEGASYSILNENLGVMAKSEDFVDGKAAAAFVRKSVQTQFPVYWADLQVRLDEQKATLAKGRELEKAKKFDEALAVYREVLQSDLKIAEGWDDLIRDIERLEEKIKRLEK